MQFVPNLTDRGTLIPINPGLNLLQTRPIGIALEPIGKAFIDLRSQLLGDRHQLIGHIDMLPHALLARLDHCHREIDPRLGILGIELDAFLGGLEGLLGFAIEEVEPGQTGPARATFGRPIANILKNRDQRLNAFASLIACDRAIKQFFNSLGHATQG
jgi:hypothetical protein